MGVEVVVSHIIRISFCSHKACYARPSGDQVKGYVGVFQAHIYVGDAAPTFIHHPVTAGANSLHGDKIFTCCISSIIDCFLASFADSFQVIAIVILRAVMPRWLVIRPIPTLRLYSP